MKSQIFTKLLGAGSMVAIMAGCAAPNQAAGSPGAAPATVAGSSNSASTVSTPDGMPPCPFAVAGTTATERDTADGIVVEFSNAGHVDEVRQRIRARAAYTKAHPKPMPVQMTKELEDSPNGIRMIVHSADPAKVDEVRKLVREQVAQARDQSAAPGK